MELKQTKQNSTVYLLGRFSYIWSSLYKSFNLNEQEMLRMNNLLDNEIVNNALGSMFGAFIGDALGAYCEFRPKPFKLNDPQLLLIMQKPGKGTFDIKPGQFTDDSQMASHMLSGLSSYDPLLPFQEQKTKIIFQIAQQYVNWFKSSPFDMGHTTKNALSMLSLNLQEMKIDEQKGIKINLEQKLKYILTKIEIKNMNRTSNGSLMRITPMVFFVSLLLQKQKENNPKISCRDFESFIKSEINLTHGNSQILESSYVWVQLLVEIINRKNAKKNLKQIYDNFILRYEKSEIIGHWIKESLKQEDMDAIVYQGKAISCFTYGIKALKTLSEIKEEYFCDENQKKSSEHYIGVIKRIISKAGDSDTNAAIVGGLVGAVLGFKRLPQNYLFKQFRLELDNQDYKCSKRGPFYEPRRQFYKAMKLVQKFEFQKN